MLAVAEARRIWRVEAHVAGGPPGSASPLTLPGIARHADRTSVLDGLRDLQGGLGRCEVRSVDHLGRVT